MKAQWPRHTRFRGQKVTWWDADRGEQRTGTVITTYMKNGVPMCTVTIDGVQKGRRGYFRWRVLASMLRTITTGMEPMLQSEPTALTGMEPMISRK